MLYLKEKPTDAIAPGLLFENFIKNIQSCRQDTNVT